jgi:glycosyltransferase involved in cell wall biosynthesis
VSDGRRRVAVIGPLFPFRGAISYCTGELGRQLSKRFDVDLISFSRQYPRRFYPGGDDVDPTVADLAPAGARYTLDILRPLTWVREGLRLRRSKPAAIVLVWWVWVWGLPYLIMLWLAGRNIPVVVQCHNVSDKEPTWWKTMLSNAIFRRASALVVHSRTGADELVGRLGAGVNERVVRLYLPVLSIGRAIPARDDAKEELGLAGQRVVLFFGHIRPFKGLDIALEAWKKVDAGIVLLVVGEVWWSSEAAIRRSAAELVVADRVVFQFGYVADAQVATRFAAADVVVAPYRHEAQSGVAMNAFHFGRAVIATSVGGIPEVIEPGINGDLVPPEDPTALAASINAFFREGKQERLEAGVRESAKRFSWDRYGTVVGDTVERLARATV